jgi:hypothetical protein
MAKSFYFTVQNGLRGCYMPDGNMVISVKSRKALREALVDEVKWHTQGENDHDVPPSEVQEAADWAWANRTTSCLPMCVETSLGHGVFIAPSDRHEYVEYCASQD